MDGRCGYTTSLIVLITVNNKINWIQFSDIVTCFVFFVVVVVVYFVFFCFFFVLFFWETVINLQKNKSCLNLHVQSYPRGQLPSVALLSKTRPHHSKTCNLVCSKTKLFKWCPALKPRCMCSQLVLLLMQYSKHPHIRTLISILRLIVFLFTGCLVRNKPESVLIMFLNFFH